MKIIKKFNNYEKYIKELEVNKLYRQLQGAYRNYKRSNSGLWASSLCYITILSFIPILAIAFSIGKWFGIDEYITRQLYESSPLNKETLDLLLNTSQNLLENTRSGVIAGVGFISLGWVVISMFSLIEKSLNSIWRIKKTRPFFRKFSDYLTVFIMLPISILVANIITSADVKVIIIPKIISILAPYLTLWFFFIIFYSVMPNTKIKFFPTLWCSFIISVLLNQSNSMLVRLQTIISTYNKIYGSFSVLLLSLIWLKIVWFLILLGAHFGYILQNRESLIEGEGIKKLNFESKEKILKLMLLEFGKNYMENDYPIGVKELFIKTSLQKDMIEDILEIMEKLDYIVEVSGGETDEKRYKLCVNINELTYEKVERDLYKLGVTCNIDIKFNDKDSIYDIIKKI